MELYEIRTQSLILLKAGKTTRDGHVIRWAFWRRPNEPGPTVVTIENWDSNSVPRWMVDIKTVKVVVTGYGTLDTQRQLELVANGGTVPGSFDHDFYRLGVVRTEDLKFDLVPGNG